jgi:hypothetical protein
MSNPIRGGTNGWFAQRRGRLILPPIALAEGDGTYNWGERADESVPDLVNSVRLKFDDVAAPGDVTIQLLSLDRYDVPTLPGGHTFLNVWAFEPEEGVAFDGVTLTVRYDDTLAQSLGLDENILKLWKFEPGEGWSRINDETFHRDPRRNLLTGAAGNDLTFFAVSAPEPSAALGAIALGGWLLTRRKRRA